MKFKNQNLHAISEMIISDKDHSLYFFSSYITLFFEVCDLDFEHDGSININNIGQRI